MSVFDGTDTYAHSKGVSSDRLNKTVLWRGTVLPIAGVNQIPTDGIFLKTDVNRAYQNLGTTESPNWKFVLGDYAGKIDDFAGLSGKIPDGWLRCNGASLLRVDYPDLFDAIGDNWGSVDSTHFNLPDLETDNKFTRATHNDTELGNTGGESTHTLTIDEMPSHSHDHNYNQPLFTLGLILSSPASYGVYNSGSNIVKTGIDATSTGGGQTHENKPPYASVYKIIKI